MSGTADSASPKHCHHSVSQSHDRNRISAFERARSLCHAASLASHSDTLHRRSVSVAARGWPLQAGSLRIIASPLLIFPVQRCGGDWVLNGDSGDRPGAAPCCPPVLAPSRVKETMTPNWLSVYPPPSELRA